MKSSSILLTNSRQLIIPKRTPLKPPRLTPFLSFSRFPSTIHTYTQFQSIQSTTTAAKMSSSTFSNADTGSKPADPYKARNIDDASLKEKVEDLNEFIDSCKFGMMTTRDASTGYLMSRCMAFAAKVFALFLLSSFLYYPPIPPHSTWKAILTCLCFNRKPAVSTSFSTPIPNPAKPMTSLPTHTLISHSSTLPANGHPFPALHPSWPIAQPSKNTIPRHSKHGLGIWEMENTMVDRKTRGLALSGWRRRRLHMRWWGRIL